MHHLKIIFLSLMILLFCLPSANADAQLYTQMPYYLTVTQETHTETVAEDAHILRTYPDTRNDEIDAQMRALIDGMAAENRGLLPLKKGSVPSYLDVGAVFTRSGTSVVSFLALAEVSAETEYLSMDHATRVYDIETGKQLSLTDFFGEDSQAWAILSRAVHQQLSAAFPALEPDADALEQLCAIDNLK